MPRRLNAAVRVGNGIFSLVLHGFVSFGVITGEELVPMGEQ